MNEEERKLLLMIARLVADIVESATTTDNQDSTQEMVTDICDTVQRIERGHAESISILSTYRPDV